MWTRCQCAVVLAAAVAAASCSKSEKVLEPEAIVIAVRLDERFNLAFIRGLRIVVDSAAAPLRLAPQAESAHEVGGVAFTTEASDVDADGEVEFVVRFPSSPFVGRTYEFSLFPSSGESAPFAVAVEITGTTGVIARARADRDATGGEIRFRPGVRGRVELAIACEESFTCAGPNRPPQFDTVSLVRERTVVAGDTVRFSVVANDPEGDPLEYRARMGAADGGFGDVSAYGASFDAQTRIFEWTPAENRVLGIDGTRYAVEFSARDRELSSDPVGVVLHVVTANRAPVFGEHPPQSVREGDPLSFRVVVADPDGDALTVTSNHAEAGVLPTGAEASFEPQTRTFSWRTRPDDYRPAAYVVTFAATDGRHPPVRSVVEITIIDVPPLENGAFCTASVDCKSASCVDRVCCSVAACEAGAVCTAPNGVCRKLPGQPCAAATDCQTGFCVDGTCCRTSFCFTGLTCANGAGECKKQSGLACSIPDECASGFCVVGVCCQSACTLAPVSRTCANVRGACLRTQGVACVVGQCQDGLTCVDGYCCASPACPRCFGCDVAGREGACWSREEEDPKGECGGSGPCKEVCRAGACVFPGGERACDDGDACTTQDSCTGDGRCAGNPWTVENPVPSIHFGAVAAMPNGNLLAASRAGPVYRRVGSSWRPEDTGTAQPVRAFSVLADDDAFAVGDRVILRRLATGWISRPVNAELRGVWAGSPTLAFAIGKEPGSERPLIYEFDGARWLAESPGVGELHAVDGIRDAQTGQYLVVAVGLTINFDGTRVPWILTNDGVTRCGASRWCREVVDVPLGFLPQAVALRSVAVVDFDGAAAVGDQGIYVEHKGTTWETFCFGSGRSPLRCPSMPPAAARLTWISRSANTSPRGGRGRFVAVTRGAELLRGSVRSPDGSGGIWSPVEPLPGGTSADRAFVVSAQDILLADSGGGIQRATGLTSLTFASLTTSVSNDALTGVWASPAGLVYAVGDRATFLKRSAAGAWSSVGGPSGNPSLSAVFGLSDQRIHATSTLGNVYTFNGTSWGCAEPQESGLTTVWEPALDGGVRGPVVGKSTKQFRRVNANATCLAYPSVDNRPAFSVWGPPQASPTPFYFAATGSGVQAYQFSTGAWRVSGAEESLADARAVWGTARDNVWAVGNEVKRYDGTSWLAAGPSGQGLCALSGVGRGMVAVGGGCFGAAASNAVFYDGASWIVDRLPATVPIVALDADPVTMQYFAVGGAGVILRRCVIPGAN